MALIKCGECSKEISDRAESCPHCGNPVAADPDIVGGRQVRTVERTAKRFKGQVLIAAALIVIGLVWGIAGIQSEERSGWPGLLLIAGLGWYVVTRVRAWWHHG